MVWALWHSTGRSSSRLLRRMPLPASCQSSQLPTLGTAPVPASSRALTCISPFEAMHNQGQRGCMQDASRCIMSVITAPKSRYCSQVWVLLPNLLFPMRLHQLMQSHASFQVRHCINGYSQVQQLLDTLTQAFARKLTGAVFNPSRSLEPKARPSTLLVHL